MAWQVEYTDEFLEWWDTLTEGEQVDVNAVVILLETEGPHLAFPYSSGISGSVYSHMRELRIQHKGEPYRILYAFDPRRTVMLLMGGCKTGNTRWYETSIPVADGLYKCHMEILAHEKKGGE